MSWSCVTCGFVLALRASWSPCARNKRTFFDRLLSNHQSGSESTLRRTWKYCQVSGPSGWKVTVSLTVTVRVTGFFPWNNNLPNIVDDQPSTGDEHKYLRSECVKKILEQLSKWNLDVSMRATYRCHSFRCSRWPEENLKDELPRFLSRDSGMWPHRICELATILLPTSARLGSLSCHVWSVGRG